MDELFDPDIFEFSFPVWILSEDVKVASLDHLATNVIVVTVAEFGQCFPLFTDQDWATRFADDLSKTGDRPSFIRIENRTTLRDVIRAIRSSRGINHVVLDFANNQGQFLPIDAFVADLENG